MNEIAILSYRNRAAGLKTGGPMPYQALERDGFLLRTLKNTE
jgi:hypothetical protein